jgi:hypothetical protein
MKLMGDYMKVVLIILILLVLSSCTKNNVDPNEVIKSLVLAEKHLNNMGFITASSSESNKFIKFRIMVKDKITNEDAKKLIGEFIGTMESNIKDKELFKDTYYMIFDIKSEKDGNILFNGKRDKGNIDIWWQF